MTLAYKPGKLLIAMVEHRKGERFVAMAKAAGARGGTIAAGRAVVDNKILQALLLADVRQDIVFLLMREEADGVLDSVCAVCRAGPKKLGGVAVMLDVAAMLVRIGHTADLAEPPANTRSEPMESGYTLLTVIVNNGYADDVMAQARKAGARGGTILTARGTASEDDVKFFGITLVPEKEVVMIVAEKGGEDAILAAVRAVPALSEPGGGIAYSINVEKLVLLGR